ncbi:hypothetical protein BGZ52_000563 [Haplosporangium bisporale]|nr:hypothetical protein BGZ52_000563 [Haplosporangium bisporale]
MASAPSDSEHITPEVYHPTAKPREPLTPEQEANSKKPKVLISGAGIGGLTLGLLLQKANIPFEIYERSKEIKPLGSAFSISGNVAPILLQLGLYDEFVELGKHATHTYAYKENLKLDFTLDYTDRSTISGHPGYIIPRPDFYNLLLRQIPKERIHMGKKVMSLLQNENGVMIRCSDSSTHHGDILVGADGAYSAVRQHLYSDLKKKKTLPTSDDTNLPCSFVCLVGQTHPLDPEEFPDLKLERSQFVTVSSKETPYFWATFTTKKNTLCWMVIESLDVVSSKQNDSFRNSEWGPEAAETMCKQVRHLNIPGGKDGKVLAIGDLIERTPKDLISKVMLEEKVFDTWYGGRTVLLGDACHKLNPAGGAGAANAIHDAVTLANWITTLETKSLPELENIFKEYHAERYPVAKAAFNTSQLFSKLATRSLAGFLTKTLLRHVPAWLNYRMLMRMSSNRPQLSFLPLIKDTGAAPPLPQPSLYKTLAILKKRESENRVTPV